MKWFYLQDNRFKQWVHAIAVPVDTIIGVNITLGEFRCFQRLPLDLEIDIVANVTSLLQTSLP